MHGHKHQLPDLLVLLGQQKNETAVPSEQFSHGSGAFESSRRLGGNMLEVPP
jgi:hypothetical protein